MHCFQFDIAMEKDIQDIQDIQKNTQYQKIGALFTPPNTFLQKLDLWLSKKFTIKNLLCSNCDL